MPRGGDAGEAPLVFDAAVALQEAPAGANGKPVAEKPVERKIISSGDVRLIVEDLSQTEQKIQEIVKEMHGYLGQSEINGSSGSPRSGHWRIRVPVDQFQPCLDALVKLGVPEKNSTEAKDVSEEYYDLEAHVKNKQIEEKRLQTYLEEKKGATKLEEILAVEKELTRVRGEIEQQQGRLRVLSSLAAMATITLSVQEIKNYVPPQAPGFGTQIGSTFAGSLDVLQRFGQGLVLVAVAFAPWLPVLAVVALPVWLTVRRWRRPPEVTPVTPVQG
jgi:hypothetical protein